MPNYGFLVLKNYSKSDWFLSFISTYLVLFNLLFILQKTWIGELWISFLPYWLVVNLLFIFILTGYLVYNWIDKKRVVANSKLSLNIFFGFIVIISSISTTISSVKVYNYFYNSPEIQFTTSTQDSLKIGFFNLLESNTNYNLINSKLQELDLDVISFAEFQDNHFQNIPILKTYQHSFPKSFPKKSGNTTTIAIFSKIEFSEISYKKLVNNNVLVAKINYKNSYYKLIINHLSNPYLPRFYENRNADIAFLENYLETIKEQKVLVLGDFNTTPWSPEFPNFLDYNNVFSGRGLYHTWQFGPLYLQIDQMFSSKSLNISDYKIDTQNGSDHHLIWVTVN